MLKTGHMLACIGPSLSYDLRRIECMDAHPHDVTLLPALHTTGRHTETCITEDIAIDAFLFHLLRLNVIINNYAVFNRSSPQPNMCEDMHVHKMFMLV